MSINYYRSSSRISALLLWEFFVGTDISGVYNLYIFLIAFFLAYRYYMIRRLPRRSHSVIITCYECEDLLTLRRGAGLLFVSSADQEAAFMFRLSEDHRRR